MKALLLGFIVIVLVANLVHTKAPTSPTHYSPHKKQWYKEFQIEITQDIIDNEGNFVFPKSIGELSCTVCGDTWDTSNWAITPGELSPFSLISNNQVRFCSIDCRNQWQISRKVK